MPIRSSRFVLLTTLMKQAKTFHVCTRCGYTTEVDGLRFCPACRKGHFAEIE